MKLRTINKQMFKTDMPLWVLALLALLAVPRVVIHDLRSLPFDSFLYLLLAVLPLAVYFAIAIFRNNKRPFYDFIVLGVLYGIFLAATHQIFWNAAWDGNLPQFGDNLAGVLNPEVENAAMRLAAIHSSLGVGLALGVIFGTLATIARKVRQRLSA